MVVLYHLGRPNAIFQQDNARSHLHAVFRPSPILRLLHGIQICHPMKIYGHGLLKDWPATLFYRIWLEKCDIDLKQHGMGCRFLSSKSSNPIILYLTG
ncbi:hypothetical protein HNY73_017321 [Argiope bruennichi]|uniref:Uncharacterized protein n=1 Tax=Argiope bruennichi TaxID=94029 RepID=A0A8T0EMG8_ARGBR|nr:hypothetical protein HNY73_017321 [Argiope bruennichi]